MSNLELWERLDEASYWGDVDGVEAILAESPAAEVINGDVGPRWEDEAKGCVTGAPYKRPLGRAASRGNLEIVEKLLAAGAEVDAPNHRGETALHLAITGGHIDCVQALIKAGASLDLVSCVGTVLHHALARVELIELLLERGADPQRPDVYGRTAATVLLSEEYVDAAERLSALQLYLQNWPAHGEGRDALEQGIAELQDQIRAKEEAQAQEDALFLALLEPEALQSEDWVERVQALLPDTMIGSMGDDEDYDEEYDEDYDEEYDEDYDEDQSNGPRGRLNRMRTLVLSVPAAIAHPEWGTLLRSLAELTPSYGELTEYAYGEAMDPEQAIDDEGGVIEWLSDEELSTIPDAFLLLAIPEAVARPDWAELFRHVLAIHEERMGRLTYLSFGCDEADELFAVPAVLAHSEAARLWNEASDVLPLDSEQPGSA